MRPSLDPSPFAARVARKDMELAELLDDSDVTLEDDVAPSGETRPLRTVIGFLWSLPGLGLV